MPGPGVSILWNESSPSETDIADSAPIRSIETSIRNAMAVEHNWPSTGGANVGYHLLGSARAFYDVQSNVSSTGTDGRLQVTSDTSRLFHVGSAGTMFLGGAASVSAGSTPVGGQRFYWAQEFGEFFHSGVGPFAVTFPNSGFSGRPFMWLSQYTDVASTFPIFSITQLGPTQFTYVTNINSKFTLMWLSLGTRTF